MIFDRTFHPDEANQAFTVGRLLETGQYTYTPTDHHGPTLYYAAAPLQKIAGHSTTQTLDGTLLRTTPLVFAILGLVLGFQAIRRITRSVGAALAFVLLLGTAPFFVFFATDFIQEMLLSCFLIGMFFSAVGYLRPDGKLKPGSWALLFGIFAGLAFATKETAVISFAAAALAGAPFLVLRMMRRRNAPPPKPGVEPPPVVYAHPVTDVVFALIAFALTSVTLYSSLGTDWMGVYHAFITAPLAYLGRAAGDAAASVGANWHVHPFNQYFKWLFAYPPFTEIDLVIVGFVGTPLCLALLRLARKRADAKRAHFVRFKPEKPRPSEFPSLAPWGFAVLYSLILLVVYSLIPYKTPWCALRFLPGFVLAAVFGLHAILVRMGAGVLPRLIVAAVVGCIVAFRLPALQKLNDDPDSKEIPCNYANASPEVKELARVVSEAMKAPCADPLVAVALPPEDTWPLPWYNRELAHRTGYWTSFEDLEKLQQTGVKPSVVVVPMNQGHLVQPLFPHLKNTRRFFMRNKVRVRVFW